MRRDCILIRIHNGTAIRNAPGETDMYHYDPTSALEELNEDAVLPNPVKLRDMMLRAHLDPDHSLEYNRLFVEYQKRFGELQQLGKQLLQGLAGKPATSS